MRRTDIPAFLVATLWGYFLLSGIDGLIGIHKRAAPDYPATGQIILYAVIPAAFVIALAAAAFASRRWRWFYDLYPTVVMFCLFAVLPVMMVGGGGV